MPATTLTPSLSRNSTFSKHTTTQHTTTAMAANGENERQSRSLHRPTDPEAVTRGRKRNRSPTRPEIRSLRSDVEASTLRGRSRCRSRSRASFRELSSLRSPSRKRVERSRPRELRREHCPSRAPSRAPSRPRTQRRRQRTQSRSGSPEGDADSELPVPEILQS